MEGKGLKLAFTGKGGVGKTTLASLFSRLLAERGRRVIAIDANPDANLGVTLGFSPLELRKIRPISELKELIAERTGVGFGVFKLNPKVDDIPDKYCLRKGNLSLLVMGTVREAGTRCLCPENAFIRNLISHLILRREEAIVMDMDAGVEHLGRGTASGVDAFMIVVEPGRKSVETARAIRALVPKLGVRRTFFILNKITSPEEESVLRELLPSEEVLGAVRFHPEIREADFKGLSPFEAAPGAVEEVGRMVEKLERELRDEEEEDISGCRDKGQEGAFESGFQRPS